jgi:hypothetical protein
MFGMFAINTDIYESKLFFPIIINISTIYQLLSMLSVIVCNNIRVYYVVYYIAVFAKNENI